MYQEEYILLLAKQQSEGLSSVEERQLEDWLQTPDNARTARDMRRIWDGTGSYAPVVATDIAADFNQVLARIRTEQAPAVKTVPLYRTWMAAAAAVALLLGAVWFFRQPTAASFGENMLAATVTAQDKQEIVLADGSKVWLRRDATLTYPANFDGKKERRVRLQGEGYFEIASRPDQPFIIETPEKEQIRVLGTKFSVRALKGAADASVLVREGKVRYTAGGKSADLTARKKAIFNRSTAALTVTEVNSLNELAWQTGGLEFVGTPLSRVLQDLESFYQVKITLNNPELAQCPYSAPLTNQPIDKVLAAMKVAYKFDLRRPASGEYVLEGGICQ